MGAKVTWNKSKNNTSAKVTWAETKPNAVKYVPSAQNTELIKENAQKTANKITQIKAMHTPKSTEVNYFGTKPETTKPVTTEKPNTETNTTPKGKTYEISYFGEKPTKPD